MIRWWAVFFMAGIFCSCTPVSCFIPIFILAASQSRRRPLSGRLLFPAPAPKYGDNTLICGRIRDFILISVTGTIVMSAANISFAGGISGRGGIGRSNNREISTPDCRDLADLRELTDRCRKMARAPVDRIRARFVRHIDDPSIDARTNHIMRALLLADRKRIDRRFYEKIRYLGVSHFLALSGLHLGIIAVSASVILNAALRGKGSRDIILFFVLMTYSAVAGHPHSLIRAVSLYAASRIFRCLGIGTSLEDALLAGSLIVISADPSLIFSKGYQLSFLAVSAISVVAIPLIDLLYRYAPLIKRRKFLALPVSAVIVTVSVQIFTLPVVLEYFGRAPLISSLSNITFLLPVSAILHLGLLQVILPLSVARVTTAPALRILTRILESVTDFLLEMPQPGVVKGDIENLGYFAGIALLTACLCKRCGKRKLLFSLSLLFFSFSFSAGSGGPGYGNNTIDPEGIATLTGDQRITIIEKSIYFSAMERYVTGLWRSGIHKVEVVIYTPGILWGRSGLDLLVRRMRSDVVYCSPYIAQNITEMAEKKGWGGIIISPVDTNLVLSGSFGEITLVAPEKHPVPGARIDSGEAGISFLVENHHSP